MQPRKTGTSPCRLAAENWRLVRRVIPIWRTANSASFSCKKRLLPNVTKAIELWPIALDQYEMRDDPCGADQKSHHMRRHETSFKEKETACIDGESIGESLSSGFGHLEDCERTGRATWGAERQKQGPGSINQESPEDL
jgi:hypothetical protein